MSCLSECAIQVPHTDFEKSLDKHRLLTNQCLDDLKK